MCGRYALHSNPDVLALQFSLGAAAQFKPRYNISPGTEILIVRRGVAESARWGLVPAWAKDPRIGNKLANARGETVAEKPAFRSAFRRGRCLVPESGFYEWQTLAGKKRPWYIRPRDAGLFGLAGITERWDGPEGAVQTVCLITTEPNELMRAIHDRMPVILSAEDYAAWLDASAHDPGRLIRPYPAARMQAYPVSRRVNTPRQDDASLIERLDSAA